MVTAKVSLELMEGQAGCSTATVLHEEVLKKRVGIINADSSSDNLVFKK